MYVEIGPYRVKKGETLPTIDLINNDHFMIMPTASVYAPYYTTIMVDLDAPYPTDPYMAPLLHYLSVNSKSGDGGMVVVPYLPPSPPPDSEPHRYEIYLFQHNHPIPLPIIETRERFDVNDFMKYEMSQGRFLLLEERLMFYGDGRMSELGDWEMKVPVMSERELVEFSASPTKPNPFGKL